ncbi:MAG: hypothetical protein N3D78_01600 [Candidatus Aenigmarchaeota archaeon]|nr:hypothetical protein [Candidatus Aenigmarchaeota archaeon]
MEESKKEEFELIPVTPLRKLEKKIEELEKRTGYNNTEIYRELVSIIRMNQEIVDALIKANDSLRIELSKLPLKIEELTKKIEELIELIKAAGEEEEETKTTIEIKPLVEKIEKLAEINNKILETNESLLSLMEQVSKKLTKPSVPTPPVPLRPSIPQQKIG